MEQQNAYALQRVVLIGNSYTGKTALLVNLLNQGSSNVYEPTIGAANYPYTKVINGTSYTIQIWDTAGQEQYKSLGPIYYRNASAGIFVFDVTDQSSFDSIPCWLQEFEEAVGRSKYLKVLIGNKIDLEEDEQVDDVIVSNYAKDNGFIYFRTSAKTGYNVEMMFQKLMEELIKQEMEMIELDLKKQSEKSGCC